jgi:hypothetical protein
MAAKKTQQLAWEWVFCVILLKECGHFETPLKKSTYLFLHAVTLSGKKGLKFPGRGSDFGFCERSLEITQTDR